MRTLNDVRQNESLRHFEIIVDGQVAGFIQYVARPGNIILVHTDIDDAFVGRGLGCQLAAATLDDIRAQGLRVVPLCPFVASYIERHPEYDDLVDHVALDALERG